jgi:hypothetical protein
VSNFRANELLGYPADARLLIINADDFGVSHAVNAAILRTLTEGIVRSTTLMAPCPWALHAMRLLRDHPEIAFGVHLTVVSEHPDYRWGPLAPRGQVPSLLDEGGFFYSNDRQPELLARARLEELEIEFRAQIEAVLAAGLRPSHLDWHCLRDGGQDGPLCAHAARAAGWAERVGGPPRSRHRRGASHRRLVGEARGGLALPGLTRGAGDGRGGRDRPAGLPCAASGLEPRPRASPGVGPSRTALRTRVSAALVSAATTATTAPADRNPCPR